MKSGNSAKSRTRSAPEAARRSRTSSLASHARRCSAAFPTTPKMYATPLSSHQVVAPDGEPGARPVPTDATPGA